MESTAAAQTVSSSCSSIAAIINDLDANICIADNNNHAGDDTNIRSISTSIANNQCNKRRSGVKSSRRADLQLHPRERSFLPQHQQRSNSSSNLLKFMTSSAVSSFWWKPTVTTSRTAKDSKIVGLKNYGLESPRHQLHNVLSLDDDPSNHSSVAKTKSVSNTTANQALLYQLKHRPDHHQQQHHHGSHLKQQKGREYFAVEKEEERARQNVIQNPFLLFYLGNLAAIKVVLYYFITIETILSCTVTTGLTMYWYNHHATDPQWQGNTLNFILVAFTLTAPMTAALTMAFTRREQALMLIADFRSFSYHLYLAHALWDWDDTNGGRTGTKDIDLVEHCDAVLAQLIGIGDELSRFLSLPNTSRSRHRHTKQGRREAARTIEVAYHLLDSMATQRLTRLIIYSERLKKVGLPSGEISRVRQYERFISSMIEQLRMLKLYRTPQAFRSFARLFTLILPPFYAPTFAQVARDVDSLGVGIAFGIITALGLVALFESHQILEDPFTAYLALDGIDVREEFEVLHYAQLINTRKLVFPDAPIYPAARRAALTSQSMRFKKHTTHITKKPRTSPTTTIVNGEGLPDSPTNTGATTVMTIPNILLKTSSSSTMPMSKSPRGGDKYTTMFTANDEDVEVSTILDNETMSIMMKGDGNTNNQNIFESNVSIKGNVTDADDDDTTESDNTDDIELGTFIEDDDHTHRESIFVQSEQVFVERDRYSNSYHHLNNSITEATNRNHYRRNHQIILPSTSNHATGNSNNYCDNSYHQSFTRSRQPHAQPTPQHQNHNVTSPKTTSSMAPPLTIL